MYHTCNIIHYLTYLATFNTHLPYNRLYLPISILFKLYHYSCYIFIVLSLSLSNYYICLTLTVFITHISQCLYHSLFITTVSQYLYHSLFIITVSLNVYHPCITLPLSVATGICPRVSAHLLISLSVCHPRTLYDWLHSYRLATLCRLVGIFTACSKSRKRKLELSVKHETKINLCNQVEEA